MMARFKKLVLLAVLLAAAYLGIQGRGFLSPPRVDVPVSTFAEDDLLGRVFAERRSSVQVHGSGIVKKLLVDDREGSRHQRFVIELKTGQTLLIAHNIDQAERIENLSPGDLVEFMGEYEWNPQGGVVHWTHRDTSGSHLPGWIRHDGRKYW